MKRFMKNFLFGVTLFLIPTLLFAQEYKYESIPGDPLNARIYTLSNGLKVYMSVVKDEPRIQTFIPVRVGSKNDPKETTGLAHYFEHMMFKGTSNVSSADYERLIAKFGGVNNAFTSYDYTGYYELFPANRFPLALELEADRMKNLVFNEKLANEY